MEQITATLPRLSSAPAPQVQRLTADLVRTRQELDSYAPEWNELLAQSSADTIFLTWEWISAWLDAVYPEAPLFVVTVRGGDGRLIAVAPFYRSEFRLLGIMKYRCLRMVGDCHCGAEYSDLIVRKGFEASAISLIGRVLLDNRCLWDCIYAVNAASWTGGLRRLECDLGAAFPCLHKRPTVFSAVELPETYEEYLSSLSRRQRSNIKRHEKLLRAEGMGNTSYCTSEEELPRFLDLLFRLHRKRWQSVGQSGSFVRRPPMERFYRRFAPEALRQGWLRVFALEVNGTVAAVQYGYAYGTTLYSVQEGYDPQARKGVGNVLRKRAIELCINDGVKTYDFLGGFSDHKRHWGAHQRWGADLLMGVSSSRNRFLFWKQIWPTGRYIREGRPACDGRSHD